MNFGTCYAFSPQKPSNYTLLFGACVCGAAMLTPLVMKTNEL
jgi:hypothetical protein